MKKAIFFLSICLFSCLTASAQKAQTKTFADRLMLEMGFDATTKQHDVSPFGVSVNAGYRFTPRLYAYARYQGTIGLYENGDIRTYAKTQNVGGGIGYVVHKETRQSRTDLWSLRAQMTGSIGNVDWKNTTYDIGLYWQSKSKCGKVAPTVGIGFRHTNSHTCGWADHNGIFVSVAFGF